MGYYIQTPEPFGRAEFLIKNHNAKGPFSIPKKPEKGEVPVVVIDNGNFEAAGIAYDKEELEAFAAPDWRSKKWLLLAREEVIKLNPKVEHRLGWE